MKKYLFVFLVVSATVNAQDFQKKFSFPDVAGLEFMDAALCADGGVIITGHFYEFNADNRVFIIKSGEDDEVVWAKEVLVPGELSTYVSSVAVGECISGGYYTLISDRINGNYFLVKLDEEGELLWTKKMLFNTVSYFLGSIKQLSNGDFLIIPSLQYYAGIVLLDMNGNLKWGKTFYFDAEKNPSFAAATCRDGGFIVSCKSGGDISLVKTNGEGEVQWSRRYTDHGIYTQAKCIIQAEDGNFVIAGYRAESVDYVTTGFAMKLDTAGTVLWHKTYSLSDWIDHFDPGLLLELPGGNMILADWQIIAEINPSGELVQVKKIGVGGNHSHAINSLKHISGNSLLVAGNYSAGSPSGFISEVVIGEGVDCFASDYSLAEEDYPSSFTVSSSATIGDFRDVEDLTLSAVDITVMTENLCLTTTTALHTQLKAAFYPNPAANMLTVEASKTSGYYEVHDMTGKLLKHEKINAEKFNINISALSSGVYFLTLMDRDNIAREKFIKR